MKHKKFYKNAIWQYGLQIIRYIFPFITLPYLTRVLEPEGYAVYAYVLAFMTFVQVVADFGFNLSGTKEVVACKGDRDAISKVVGSVTQARILLIVALLPVVVSVSLFIPILHDCFLYVLLAFVAVVLKALLPDFIFQGMEHMGPLTIRFFLSKSVSTVLTFIVVHSVSDMIWVPILDCIAGVIALVWSFTSMRRLLKVGFQHVSWASSLRDLKESAIYCISNTSAAVFSGFSTLLIGYFVTDKAEIAYWGIAVMAILGIQSLYAPIGNSLYPHMLNTSDFGFTRKLALIASPIVAVGTVAFALLAHVIMLVLGGYSYLDGAYVLVWTSPVLFFSFFTMYFGWPILGATGRVKELVRTTIISAVFNIVALLALVAFGWISLVTVAVVRCATEALACVLRLWECQRWRKTRLSDEKLD